MRPAISNIETCALPKIARSFSSALTMPLLTLSCSLFFLMYAHSLDTTSVRGIGLLPTTAASCGLGVSGFMNAAFGVRFLAGAFFAAAFLAGGAFFARAGFFAAALFARGLFSAG